MNADGGAAALERFCILAKNYKGRGLAETIQQVRLIRCLGSVYISEEAPYGFIGRRGIGFLNTADGIRLT
jgi:hypothetical protein